MSFVICSDGHKIDYTNNSNGLSLEQERIIYENNLKESERRKTLTPREQELEQQVRNLQEALRLEQQEVKALQRSIVQLAEEKIELTEKFLNHIQERQRDDKAWIESLRNKY